MKIIQSKEQLQVKRTLPYFFYLLMLILLLTVGRMDAFADSPVITVTPRVSTASIGDTVTFDYSVTGVSQYRKISALISYYADEDLTEYGGAKSISISRLSGSFSYTVTAGYGVMGTVYLTDTLGQTTSADSSIVLISSFSAPDPVITVAPRVSTARIGDSVTFDYSITGLDSYQQLFALVSVYGDEELSQYSDAKSFSISSLSGSFSYTVTAGFGIVAEIYLKDLISNSFMQRSSIVRITDFSTPDPVITVTPRVMTAKIGDTVTFDYSVSGIDSYQDLFAFVSVYSNEGLTEDGGATYYSISGYSGSFSYLVTAGYGICGTVYVTDSIGVTHSVRSDVVRIESDPPPTPVLAVSPDTIKTISGETITFDYSILDIDSYRSLKAYIYLYPDENWSSPVLTTSVPLYGLVGSFIYRVSSGYGVYSELYLLADDDQEYTCESSVVQILPLPEFMLPDNLQRIETEVFHDVPVKSMYIPAGVTYIGPDAIPSGTFIFAEDNSYAANWAWRNNYQYYLLNGQLN